MSVSIEQQPHQQQQEHHDEQIKIERDVCHSVLFPPLTFQLPAMMGCRIFNSEVILLVVRALPLMVLNACTLPQRAAEARREILDSFMVEEIAGFAVGTNETISATASRWQCTIVEISY